MKIFSISRLDKDCFPVFNTKEDNRKHVKQIADECSLKAKAYSQNALLRLNIPKGYSLIKESILGNKTTFFYIREDNNPDNAFVVVISEES